MLKHKELIIAYANGACIECKCKDWQDWMLLTDMRDSAIRTFLGITKDPEWEFRVKK